MKEKVSEKTSSLVIVSRRLLITGITGIAIPSFCLGYFFGYGGNSADKVVKPVEADNKVVPSEEKTVLDSSGKPTMVPPPATPGVIPKEPPAKPRPWDEPKTVLKIEEPQKPAGTPVLPKADSKKEAVNSQKKSDVALAPEKSPEKGPEKRPENKITGKPKKQEQPEAKTKKERVKPAAKKAKAGRTYALQVGAFEDASKAERLKKELSAKGYKASVTTFSPVPGKTFSRVRFGPYTTRKEAEELVATLKSQGLESIVVYGSK